VRRYDTLPPFLRYFMRDDMRYAAMMISFSSSPPSFHCEWRIRRLCLRAAIQGIYAAASGILIFLRRFALRSAVADASALMPSSPPSSFFFAAMLLHKIDYFVCFRL